MLVVCTIQITTATQWMQPELVEMLEVSSSHEHELSAVPTNSGLPSFTRFTPKPVPAGVDPALFYREWADVYRATADGYMKKYFGTIEEQLAAGNALGAVATIAPVATIAAVGTTAAVATTPAAGLSLADQLRAKAAGSDVHLALRDVSHIE